MIGSGAQNLPEDCALGAPRHLCASRTGLLRGDSSREQLVLNTQAFNLEANFVLHRPQAGCGLFCE
jgi:hypothetical protein